MSRFIEININNEVFNNEKIDIQGEIYFNNKETLDIATVYLWNVDSTLADRTPKKSPCSIVLGSPDASNESFIGIVEDIDYIETETDRGVMVTITSGHEDINEKKLTASFTNVSYSSILRWFARQLGLGVGEINIKKDVKFTNYTVFHTLAEFMKEIRVNTAVFAYVKDRFVYATPVENKRVSFEDSEVYFGRSTTGENIKLNFKGIHGEVEGNMVIFIGKNSFQIVEGRHVFSTEKDWFTEVEVVANGR